MTDTIQTSLMDIHPDELLDLIQDIPTLPAIHQTLCTKMRDSQGNVAEIADIIAQEPALTAGILQFVNTAFCGNTSSVKTISRAVVILGFRAVRSAAVAISVFDYFHDEQSSDILARHIRDRVKDGVVRVNSPNVASLFIEQLTNCCHSALPLAVLFEGFANGIPDL